MITLRCTKRLLEYFSERPTAAALAVESEPLLGEWFANVIRYGETGIALCVNEMTRYAIVIPLDGCESILTLNIRLAQRVFDAMQRQGIAKDTSGCVLDEYRGGVRIANTNNRSVLGTIN